MPNDESAVRLFAQLAGLLYAAALMARLRAAHVPARWRRARRLWTLGCIVFLVHVYCAFAIVHQWSHTAAYVHTARRTAELTGFHWGGGLYLNYLFTFVWIADALWWWLSERTYQGRFRWIEWTIQSFMAFMFFNSAVVFGPELTRWVGALITVVLLVTAFRSHGPLRS